MSCPLYVYGIVPAPGVAPVCPGINGASVTVQLQSGLAALVSGDVEPPLPRLRRHMLLHTKVLEQAMALNPVLPLRFGSIAPDATALGRCLAHHAASFHAALADITDKIEVGVKANWREGGVYETILATDPALRQARDALRGRAPAETYYARIDLGRRVEAALAARGEMAAGTIRAALTPLAERMADLPVQEEDMILNAAFLVPRRHEAAFDAAIAAIAAQFADTLRLRYITPVPPFNFVSVHANWLENAA